MLTLLQVRARREVEGQVFRTTSHPIQSARDLPAP